MPPVPAPDGRAQVVQRRYHLHFPGVAYAGTLLVIVLGAINGQNNLLFWLFGLGVAGLLLSGIVSGAGLMGLEVRREVAKTGGVGRPLELRYRIANKNRLFPVFGLTVEEVSAPVAGLPNADWPARIGPIVGCAEHVPVGKEVTVRTRATPRARGIAHFTGVRVWTTFPFGLTKKSVTFAAPGEVLIHPFVAELRPPAELLIAGRGEVGRRLRRGRTGDEFYSLREYAHGDSVRQVAWRPTARLGRVVVREAASHPGRRVWVGVVASVANADACVSAVAGLAREALRAGLEVGVLGAAGDARLGTSPRAGERHLERCLDVLAVIETGVIPALAEVGERDEVLVVSDSGAPIAGMERARVISLESLGDLALPQFAEAPVAMNGRLDRVLRRLW